MILIKKLTFQKSLTGTVGKFSRIPGIVELMSKRSNILKKHTLLRVIPPTISEVSVAKREQYASELVNNFTVTAKIDKLPKKVMVYYRHADTSAFEVLEMKDNGQQKDAKANDTIFTATIPSGENEQISYYIVAENAASINFSPSNYMFEQYTADLKELN